MKKTGIELISDERSEQLEKHGRSIRRDVMENSRCQLADAAGQLINPELDISNCFTPKGWYEDRWQKMIRKPYKQRLIIAGALIAAELDRITALGG